MKSLKKIHGETVNAKKMTHKSRLLQDVRMMILDPPESQLIKEYLP